jgi:PAS domain S-box-containing protein
VKAPDVPIDEAARLASLSSYQILDTASEAAFDGLTRLAASILGVPVALVSFVDADRQWFKSRYGLDAAETPRSSSFCGHVVANGEALVVADTRDDARFSDNPLVTGEPRIRFYAGTPLRTPEGFVLGTLCAIDRVPRQPTPEQLAMLALLAAQVVDQLEARRERNKLAVERLAALDGARKLGVLFEAMAEGVVQQDRDGVITQLNPAAMQILGLSFDQVNGRASTDPRWRCVHEDGSPFPGETHPAMVTLQTGEPCSNVIMGVHKPDGLLTWISINSRPLRADDADARPTGALTTFHDITAVKAAQAATARLHRQEHLITTGTLAARAGHEINNPLTYIVTNLEMSIDEVRALAGGAPSERMRELLDGLIEAREGAERIRKIVRGLRSLAREEAAPIPTDIQTVIDVALDLAAHELRSKATVTRRLAPTPSVLADNPRLTQVLVNLLVNAGQAFPTGDIEKNRITVTSAVEPDGRVSITVSDNGPGIPAEVRHRVFDPFFTTRVTGEGAGLGLSISQSIIRALDGEIVLESTVGEGTSFRVLLPVAPRSLEADKAPRGLAAGARGRILVIDDEPVILSAIRRIIEREHDVVVSSDPREALKRLESGEVFDIVFCDLMMPHLGGDQLYARVREANPSMAERFIFITGGAPAPRVQAFLDEVQNERIEKPFGVQSLREIARRAVNARGASR